MEYVEYRLSVKLKEDIPYKNLPEKLTNAINQYFLLNEKLKKFHKANAYKFYTFDYLTPFEEDLIYRKNKIYNLRIRLINNEIKESFSAALVMIKNSIFTIVGIDPIIVKKTDKKIKYLKTLTPAIIEKDYKNLSVVDMDLNLVKKRAISNVNKKYKVLNKLNKFYHDFIEDVELISEKSIVFDYKNGFLIGNKYRFKIKEDSLSQDLAFLSLGAGILERNALSFGFCIIDQKEA